MPQNIPKATDHADYTIQREYLGDITVAELITQIIRPHLFPPSGQETALSQAEKEAQVHNPIRSENFL